MQRCLIIISALLLPAVSAEAALIVNGFDQERHDRFADSPSFIGSVYNWSGVGQSTSTGRWATLISDSFFLSATHARPAAGETIRFHASNDPGGNYVDRIVSSFSRQLGRSDLWLGKLSASVDPLADRINSFAIAGSNVSGRTVFMFGQASGPPGQNQRVGTNRIDYRLSDYQSHNLGASTGDVYYSPYNPGVADDALFAVGDSGAPSFVVIDEQPVLAGIHWFRASGIGSGDSAVDAHITGITGALAEFGETPTLLSVTRRGRGGRRGGVAAVPEPALPALALLLLQGSTHRRRSAAA